MMLFMAIDNHANAEVGDAIANVVPVTAQSDTVGVDESKSRFDFNDASFVSDRSVIERVIEEDFESILAIIGVFFVLPLMVIVLVCISYYNKRKREKAKYDLMEKVIASGKDIPIDFFTKTNQPKDYMQRGIIYAAASIGIFLFLFFVADKELSTIACIPFFIGLGQIIIHLMNQKEKKAGIDEISA